MVWRGVVFVIGSAVIVLLSGKSLRDPRAHGYFRFLAFESILGLILLNIGFWVRHPLSALQIVSWTLLILSGFLVIHGFYLLRQFGKPRGKIEDTTKLVTIGVYKYIRHPLYGSLLALGWGAFLKDVSPASVVLAAAATGFLIGTAKVEEAENLARFGDSYREYMKKTRMFIPFVF